MKFIIDESLIDLIDYGYIISNVNNDFNKLVITLVKNNPVYITEFKLFFNKDDIIKNDIYYRKYNYCKEIIDLCDGGSHNLINMLNYDNGIIEIKSLGGIYSPITFETIPIRNIIKFTLFK